MSQLIPIASPHSQRSLPLPGLTVAKVTGADRDGNRLSGRVTRQWSKVCGMGHFGLRTLTSSKTQDGNRPRATPRREDNVEKRQRPGSLLTRRSRKGIRTLGPPLIGTMVFARTLRPASFPRETRRPIPLAPPASSPVNSVAADEEAGLSPGVCRKGPRGGSPPP